MKQMNFREELAKLTPRLRDGYQGKIYVFGTGQLWQNVHKLYKDVVNVDLIDYIYAFVDSDPAKQGTIYMNRPIISSAEIDVDNAVVLIASFSFRTEIAEQLQKLGLVYANSYYYSHFFDRILKRFVFAETASFANSVQGGRCFLIGNGPNLLIEDLETLYKNGATCFGVNKIYNIFNKTAWRPTYYFLEDPDCFNKAEILHHQMKCPQFFVLYMAKQDLFNEYTYYFESDFSPYDYDFPYRPKFSNNIERTYVGGGIIYTAMQAAVSMGFDEIYLIGIDLKLDFEVLHDGTIVKQNVRKRHFYENDKLSSMASNESELLNVSCMLAREYCESHNIKIRNASRGGALEIFERVDFDSLFNN